MVYQKRPQFDLLMFQGHLKVPQLEKSDFLIKHHFAKTISIALLLYPGLGLTLPECEKRAREKTFYKHSCQFL